MSDLKRFIKACVVTILDYHTAQMEQTRQIDKKTPSASSLLKLSDEELFDKLEALIREATQSYDTRKPVMQYLLHLISTFKPLVKKDIPLRTSQYEQIQVELTKFLLNMQLLMKTSHSDTKNITYGKESKEMYGFTRGFSKGYTPCISAQIIEKIIFNPLNVKPDTSEAQIKETIKELVDEHQSEVSANLKLREEIETLKRKLAFSEEENKQIDILEEKLRETQEREEQSQLENATKLLEILTKGKQIDELKDKVLNLEKEMQTLFEKNEKLTVELMEKTKQLETAQNESARLLLTKEEVEIQLKELRKENAELTDRLHEAEADVPSGDPQPTLNILPNESQLNTENSPKGTTSVPISSGGLTTAYFRSTRRCFPGATSFPRLLFQPGLQVALQQPAFQTPTSHPLSEEPGESNHKNNGTQF